MLSEELCCNCNYYDGVHGVKGCAPCSHKKEIVLWNQGCEDIWLIPERMKSGHPSNFDYVRELSLEELACFFANAYVLGAIQERYNAKAWKRWLQEEVKT